MDARTVINTLNNIYKECLLDFEKSEYDKINRGICYLVIDYCKKNNIESREILNFLHKNKPSLFKFQTIYLSSFFYKRNKLGFWWKKPKSDLEKKKLADLRLSYLYQLTIKKKL